jgi:hypothetical protein
MKKYLVNYANAEFYSDQKRFSKAALKQGIDEVFSYKDLDIRKTAFYKKNKETLDIPKGGGLWLWKPYVIFEAMKKIKEGDLLIYADSAAKMINRPEDMASLCKEQGGILLFTNTLTNKIWTKRDCFVWMNCDSERYWNAKQAMGGFQVYIKNKKSMKFVREFLRFCQIPRILEDQLAGWPNKCGLPDLQGFRAGRNDQSVLSTLAVKYRLKLFRDPSQNGNHLKILEFREKGEWLNYPYVYSDNPDKDSKYFTIFYNYRGRKRHVVFLHKIHSKLPRRIKILNKKGWDYLRRNKQSDI